MKNKKVVYSFIGIILFYVVIYIIKPIIESNIKVISAITSCIVFGVFYFTKFKKKFKIKNLIILFIIIVFIIRGMYIVYTPINKRQHDVHTIDAQGHFHLISAGWLRINTMCNVPLERSLEGIQVVTAIISALTLLVSYEIVNKIKIKEVYKLFVMLIMAFHPTFIILSGSINNDSLLTLFMFLIILYLIKWHENPNIKNTVLLALYTGLCVMTKISGGIMAIPIIVTFVDKAISKYNEKGEVNKIINKAGLFACISMPIGLWYSIRNYLLFNQPWAGVVTPIQSLYVGNYSNFSRFFSLSFRELFGNVYSVLPGEYNVLSAIIKTSVLGEFSYNNIDIIATLLKIVNIVLIILLLYYAFILVGKNKKGNDNYFVIKLLLYTWITNLISYYAFNIAYPYGCTMDFRYLISTILCGILVIFIGIEEFNKNKTMDRIVEIFVSIFSTLSILMFFSI